MLSDTYNNIWARRLQRRALSVDGLSRERCIAPSNNVAAFPAVACRDSILTQYWTDASDFGLSESLQPKPMGK